MVGVSSSARFKEDVEPLTLELASKALDLDAVTFRHKEGHGINRQRRLGFIAEQAQEAGMELWVIEEDDGTANGFHYPELTAAHNVLIKDLYAKIEELEGKLNAEPADHHGHPGTI
jgi:hypothetical protein